MPIPPTIAYTAYKINPGVDLALTGEGTPNLTATYGDYGNTTVKKASCTLSISYSNVTWEFDDKNNVVVTGNITGAQLVRTATGSAASTQQEVTVWFNNEVVFYQIIDTASSGTYNLNIPPTFSVPIAPSFNPQPQYPAAIHFKNHNTSISSAPDEFALGIIVTNPNPPDYRPGEIRRGTEWLSHNRNGGKANILKDGVWTEMRTIEGTGNPPSIMVNGVWRNQMKLGKE